MNKEFKVGQKVFVCSTTYFSHYGKKLPSEYSGFGEIMYICHSGYGSCGRVLFDHNISFHFDFSDLTSS